MKLSHVERVILANQYKILSLLDERNADGYDLVREALEKATIPLTQVPANVAHLEDAPGFPRWHY